MVAVSGTRERLADELDTAKRWAIDVASDPLGYIALDEHGTCPHDYAKGLGCHVCDPAGSPDAGQCVECGRQMTTAEAIRSDACPDCDPASVPKTDGYKQARGVISLQLRDRRTDEVV
jgi:hypothetical protein